MSAKSRAFRQVLEKILPEHYRAGEATTVDLQERGKQNPDALTPEEKAALQGTPSITPEDLKGDTGAPDNVVTPPRQPGQFETAVREVEGDMFRDPMPGRPPDIPSPDGRDLEHRTPTRNINLDRVRAPEDIKALIDEVARQNEPLGTTTHKSISAKAGREDVLRLLADGKPQDAWNPPQLLAARRLMMQEAERLHETAVDLTERHALDPKSVTAEEWAEFGRMKTRYSAFQKVVQGKVRIAAQTLNSLQITAGPGARKARLQEMDEVVGQLGGPGELARQAQLLARADPEESAGKFGKLAAKLTTGREVAFSIWINGLLSSPTTHAVNVLSNALTNVYESAVINPLGGVVGGTRGLVGVGNQADRMRLGENTARLAGTVSGIMDGVITGAGRALGPRGVPGIGKGTKVDVREYVVSTGNSVSDYLADMAMQGPSRFLDGEDQFFKVVAYRQELNAQAYRKAAGEGLKGEAFRKRVNELITNPTEDLHLASLDHAERITFTNRPEAHTLFGALGNAGSNFRSNHPMATLIIPFVRTPSNIADYALKNIPLANTWQIVDDWKAGGAKADAATARFIVSWTALLGIAHAVDEGVITGSGPPRNQRLQQQYAGAGYRPNAIRVGDTWYGYDRLDPMGLVLQTIADLAEGARHSKDPENLTRAVMTAALGFAENLIDSTYLRGVADIFNILRSGDAGATKGISWLARLGSTAVPYTSARGYVARSQDVTEEGEAQVRQSYKYSPEHPWTALVNQFSATMPNMRDDLPLSVDWKGDYVTRDYGGYFDEFFPVKYSEVKKDKVAAALWENRVSVMPPSETMRWSFALGGRYPSEDGGLQPTTINLLDLDPRGEVYEQYQKMVGKERYRELQLALARLGYEDIEQGMKGENTEVASVLSEASSRGLSKGKTDFMLWYIDNARERGWPEPDTDQWNALAESQRPLVSNEANPDAPEAPLPEGALRF